MAPVPVDRPWNWGLKWWGQKREGFTPVKGGASWTLLKEDSGVREADVLALRGDRAVERHGGGGLPESRRDDPGPGRDRGSTCQRG